MTLINTPLAEVFDFYNGKAVNCDRIGNIPIYGSNGIIGVTEKPLFYNAIILGRVGAYCGSVMRCKDNFWASDNTIVVKPKKEKADLNYCYYLLKNLNLNNYAGGAAQPLITQITLKQIVVRLPEMHVQRRIADILSAYDDLIDNNQKQIKLLEEASVRLYKEWFVNLRFPGHENTPIVDSVPEGWTYATLNEYIKVNPDSITKLYKHEDIQYVDISSVNRGRIESKTGYHLTEAPGRAKRLAKDGDTIWGMVRPNLRSYALVLEPDENDVFSTGFSILSPGSIPFTFLHCMVTQDEFVGYLVNCTNGAAYPAVKPNHFEEFVALIPNEELLIRFHNITEPLFRKCKRLDTTTTLLGQARDKLLPKLMSGEIEV